MQSKTELMVTGRKNFLQDRKILILVGLLVAIGIVLALQYRGGSTLAGTKSADAVKIAKQRGQSKVQDPLETADPGLLLDRLQPHGQADDGGKRNLFDYGAPPPPPPPTPQQIAKEKAAAQLPPSVCGDGACQAGESFQNCPADCAPPPPPPPPEIKLKYIGYLSQQGGPVAFLTDGKEIYMGRVNDIIANKYKILKITDEGVELGYLNLNQSRTIPFLGNNRS
jgi:hypothetical protein